MQGREGEILGLPVSRRSQSPGFNRIVITKFCKSIMFTEIELNKRVQKPTLGVKVVRWGVKNPPPEH